MVYAAFISAIILVIILLQMVFIGKYISVKQEVFVNNQYASFVLGFITYFFVTFVVFFLFVIFDARIIYFIIFFCFKDAVQIIFLLTRRSAFVGMKFRIKDAIALTLVAVGALFLFNYTIDFIQYNRFNTDYVPLQTWYKFQDAIASMTSIDIRFIHSWFSSLLISFFGFASVLAFTLHFSKRAHWWTYLFAGIVTVAMFYGFSFSKPLESIAGPFLILFSILAAVNIVIYSRRRYAVLYGMTTITAWTFSQYLTLVILLIAFVTLVIYTILQKPKVSMFWVQLVAPSALVSTFWINSYSNPLGVVVTVLAILLYIFMVSVGRVKLLDRLNDFFLRGRFIIPITIFVALILAGVLVGFRSKTWNQFSLESLTYLYYGYNSLVASYVQVGIYAAMVVMVVVYVAYTFIYKSYLLKQQIVVLMAALAIIFALNPAFWALLKGSVLEGQFNFFSFAILPPLVIVGFTKLGTVLEPRRFALA